MRAALRGINLRVRRPPVKRIVRKLLAGSRVGPDVELALRQAKSDAFAALVRGPPLVERTVPRLDFVWYRPPVSAIPQRQWALEATGVVDLPAGRYTLQTISDDAIRVWVDGALVIDHWQPHESEVDVTPLGAGRHSLRVQYVQVDGWAELRLEILRGPPSPSRGSPGPH